MTDGRDEQDYDADYRFEISLQMSHPTMHPDVVTHALGLQPEGGWIVGEARRTPSGLPLEGYNKESYWYLSERFERRRDFFDASLEFIARTLEPCAEFITHFNQTGGEVAVCLQIPGDANIGDVITARGLAKIAALGVEMSVEVFPNMD